MRFWRRRFSLCRPLRRLRAARVMRSACMNSTRESGLGTTNTPSSSTFSATLSAISAFASRITPAIVSFAASCASSWPNSSGRGVLMSTSANSPSTSARRASLPAIARHSCDCTPQEDRNCASIACVFSVEETTRIRSMKRISPPFDGVSSVRSKADARRRFGHRREQCGRARPALRRKRRCASSRAGTSR